MQRSTILFAMGLVMGVVLGWVERRRDPWSNRPHDRVRCWGEQSAGELGYPGESSVALEDALDVRVGGTVVEVRASEHHTCALLTKGNVRCWGSVPLGYPDFWPSEQVETPAELGDVDVGGVVTTLATGLTHTRALLHTGAVRCWGSPKALHPAAAMHRRVDGWATIAPKTSATMRRLPVRGMCRIEGVALLLLTRVPPSEHGSRCL